MEQNRFKSWALWLAMGALIVFVLKQFFGIEWSDEMNNLLNLLCPILAGFGIINVPTDKQNF